MKKCTTCGVVKPLTEFYKHRITKDGLAHICKDCSRKRQRAFTKTGSGIYTQIKSRTKYAGEHPGEGRGVPKEISISRESFTKWYSETPKVCGYCGIPEKDLSKWDDAHNNKTVRLTVDCINNDLGYSEGNIILSCLRCNGIKSDIFDYDTMYKIGQKYIRPIWERQLEQ